MSILSTHLISQINILRPPIVLRTIYSCQIVIIFSSQYELCSNPKLFSEQNIPGFIQSHNKKHWTTVRWKNICWCLYEGLTIAFLSAAQKVLVKHHYMKDTLVKQQWQWENSDIMWCSYVFGSLAVPLFSIQYPKYEYYSSCLKLNVSKCDKTN